MKHFISLLIVLLLILIISNCAHVPAVQCYKPPRPSLVVITTDRDLLNNFNLVVNYSLELESTITCYEKK